MKKLKQMADKLRIHSLKSTTIAGSGHATSCMSCAEIMSALFFSELKANDQFILSKGHAAPILWACYAEAGIIPAKKLNDLRKIGSTLEGHPTTRMDMVKIATGSLGQGLSAGAGMALCTKNKVYVLLGDGEMAEGAAWEAVNIASHYKLSNLIAIIDVNRLGQSQETMHGYTLGMYKKKFESFGWNTIIINGHNTKSILGAFAKAGKSKKPTAIIARTIKGKGVSFLENKNGWHGRALNKQELEKALKQIGKPNVKLKSKIKKKKIKNNFIGFRAGFYKKGEETATRDAYGRALLKIGEKNKKVMILDGDVKNSTRAEAFFKKYPSKSCECYIAEQNMIGMACGISAMGYIPFCATFSAFLTRAYDFIRMAQYSNANIKIMGSHSGISIGQDGPSQMGLEDISMFLAMPESVILYPCDAVSCEKLVNEMGKHKGITYLRTTRPKTPVIYSNSEKFRIGGLKILRKSKKDKALVIGAGITVHEALKAYDILNKKGIKIRVIDLYSVKPIDSNSLIKNARECKGKVVVAEDHYFNGIGSMLSSIIGPVKHLYVKKRPRSGKPEELMKKYRIDYNAIVRAVKKK